MAYLLSSLLAILSIYSHPTISVPVSITGSDYKLSTDITYAIYNPDLRMYLNEKAWFSHISDTLPNGEKWKIEIQKWGSFALKNVGTGEYIYYGSDHTNWRGQSSVSAYNEMYMGFEAHLRNTGDLEDLPTIDLRTPTHAGTQYGVGTFEVTHKSHFTGQHLVLGWVSGLCNYVGSFQSTSMWWRDMLDDGEDNCKSGFSKLIFIPQTLPKNCESITASFSDVKVSLGSITGSFSDVKAFDEVEVSLDDGTSITHTNAASTPRTFSTPAKKHCKAFTSTFSRTSGTEQTKGFGIEVDMTVSGGVDWKIFSAGASTSIGTNYHTDWKYYDETTETKEEEEERCTEWPAIETECPARTICKRNVLLYKPTTDQADTTVTARCDGIKYEIKGKTSVDGVIKMEYQDTMEPLDCKYYTTDYNLFNEGTLQFCDTCNNDQRCEICRDEYILLDGVCVTQNTCEYVCGGDTKGAGLLEDGSVPWSGAFCEINNPSKFTSEACQKQLGKI